MSELKLRPPTAIAEDSSELLEGDWAGRVGHTGWVRARAASVRDRPWRAVDARDFAISQGALNAMSLLFEDLNGDPAIHGYVHVPARPTGKAIVLTHGAGADCQSKLLVEMSNALAESGFTVLRFDLPFRRERPHGPPSPANAARDRDGLRRVVSIMREQKNSRIFLGGHSYGGRQATMLASEEPQLADGLLVFSYPLHPPRKPNQLRTSHFPKLTTP